MATPAQRTNTWILNEWYDQAVAGNVSYNSPVAGEWWCWGNQQFGQLGQNEATNDYSSPKQIPGTTWADLATTSKSYFAVAGVKNDGTLWTWGRNVGGMLGHNVSGGPPTSGGNISSPVQVGTDTNWGKRDDGTFGGATSKMAINADSGFMMIKTDGTLWSMGYNGNGGLGQNEAANAGKRSSPTQVGTETTWKWVSGGEQNIAAIKTDGTLWVWGSAYAGRLGLNEGSENRRYSSPTQVGTDSTWQTVNCGDFVVGATKTDGTGWIWGSNNSGNLGQNNTPTTGLSTQSSPIQLPGTTWKQIIGGGEDYAFGLKTDGTAWAWGRNQNGILGLNVGGPSSAGSVSSPTQIGTDATWRSITSGNQISSGIKTDGTLWTWGNNGTFLGRNLPSNSRRSSPVQVPGTWWRVEGYPAQLQAIKSS